MALNDKTSGLELRIEVNEQNLSMFSEKNISTLRLQTDPSWPKIPLHRLTNRTNNIIKPSCVTLTRTPSKNCNTVRAITCQYPKPNKKYEVITQISNRLPDCVDPRFRRQTLQQKNKKSDESCNMENNKQKTQIDRCILQKIKKVEENSQVKLVSEDANDYMSSYHDINKENVTKSMKKSTDCLVKKGPILEMKTNYCTMASLCVANERHDIEHTFFQEQKQPIKSDGVKNQENVKNIYTTSTSALTSKSMSTFKNLANKKCLPNDISSQYDVKSNDDISRNKIILCYNKYASDWIHNTEKINLNVSLNQGIINEIPVNRNHQNFNIMDNINNARNDKNILNLNIPERLRTAIERNNIDSHFVIGDHIIDNDIKRERSSEKIIVASSVRPYTNMWKQEIVKNKRLIMNELSMSTRAHVRNDKMLQKCIQTLALSEVRSKKYSKNKDENKKNHRESKINQKCKTALLNLSKKAKSFFRKKYRLAVRNSDCILILPGPCRIKGTESKPSKRTKFYSLRSLQTENSFKKLSSISFKYQKLLNKNYWEYYIKLKRKIVIAKSDTVGGKKKRLNKSRDCSLESRILQRCSLFSCMINTMLRDPIAVSGKLSSNSTMSVTSNMHKNIYNASELLPTYVNKIKREKVRQVRRQLLGFKTIGFLKILEFINTLIAKPLLYRKF